MKARAALENDIERQAARRYAASPQQERVWSLQAGNNAAYRSQRAVLIEGRLDTDRLGRALDAAVSRHEILRTTFRYPPAEAGLVQVLNDTAQFAIEELPVQDRAGGIDRLLAEMRRKRLDLEHGPLLQVQVLKLREDQHLLLASISALCGDSATLSNLLIELAGAGDQFHNPLQYADYAQWQRDVLASQEAEAGRRYWRKKDLSLQLGLDPPFESSREGSQDFEPAAVPCPLDGALTARLTALGGLYETSPAMFLLTAWIVLLWRITGRDDLVVGVRCDGRKYAELDRALGLFAKYLPLSCELESHSRFDEIVRRVHQSAQDNHRWQESFSWEQAAPSASPPFCSASFEYLSEPASPFSFAARYECIERYEVQLSCLQKDDGLNLALRFDSGLYRAYDIARLGERLRMLMQAAAANPETRIGELPLLGEAERHRLVFELNDSRTDCGADQVVHRLFEKQVQRTPDATAVVYEDQQLSYAALNRRAGRLARYLQQKRVGPEALVALCAERGVDMLVGLLAVLKAGGAYVPLDPGYPKERLASMLEDCHAAVVLTQSWLAEALPQVNADLIFLDAEAGWITPGGGAEPAAEAGPQNLVYVIYTSGSTGKPKGVAIEHRQLVNYSRGIAKKLKVFAGAGHAALSTLAADLGNTAIFPSLITGGCLHIISSGAVQDAAALGEYFANRHVDFLKITPSHLAAVHASRNGKSVMPRETLVLGGEASSASWVRELTPACAVVNHYGPTETTVGALVYAAKDEPGGGEAASVPLGQPLANALAYVLNEALSPTPVGVTGEIYLGGEGVGRGYLNRPEITAASFIPDPFAPQAGSRLYRTGDLARRRADGAIDFLGRLDHQVKIRGFRIELGEIEAALAEHRGVRTAVVLAREYRPGSQRLVAYIEPQAGQAIQSEDLRNHIRNRLPEYMAPAEYVVLAALPLTANGKVDRRALPAPEPSESRPEAGFVPARTEVEAQLARIWAEVLGLERVSVHANFFRLGGDSILSIQIVSRARELGYPLTARDVFERQTIAELAGAVNAKQLPQAEQGLVSGEVPLTPIQRRFFEQDFAEPHHWNQSVLLEARQPLSAILTEQAFERLLTHHDALRLRFIDGDGSTPRQVNSEPDGIVPFTQVDLSALSEARRGEAEERLASEAHASLHLSQGPLLRIVQFHFGHARPDALLIVIHHLAIDVVSWRVLIEDLQSIYQQLGGGQPVTLPAKTTSYQQWARRLVEHAQSPEVLRQSHYWLADTHQTVAAPPADYCGGTNSEGSACANNIWLDERETEKLLREIPEAYRVQIDDILLTALAQAFASWTGSPRLLVELESHGRHDISPGVDLSRTVGWFTARFPVLLDLGESREPGPSLKAVKEQLRNVPQRGLGYGLLRYLSGDARIAAGLRAQPRAQVSFNYLGQFDQVFSSASLFSGTRELHASAASPRAARAHLLEIIGRVAQGRMQFSFRYSGQVHRRATMERLGRDFLAALRSITAHCLTDSAGGLTPSDFPEAQLNQDELDSLMAKFG